MAPIETPVGGRPLPGEYAEYYGQYIHLVPDGDIVPILRGQIDSTLGLLRGVSDDKWNYRYAPDKWTTREVVGHLVDAEWIFTNRALRFARGDTTPVPGIEQDDYVARANFADRQAAGMLREFQHLRAANVALFESFTPEILLRTGVASECPFTVRSILYVIAGHELHHRSVLENRYL
jgi:hypothetical protein